MSDFELDPEPAHDRAAFARRIAAVLARGWPRRLALAPGSGLRPDGWDRHPDARLVVMLRGSQRYRWLDGEREAGVELQPGDGLWIAPGAPMRVGWEAPGDFLGVVLRPQFLRFLVGRAPGGEAGPSPWAHHAPLPLGEPGTLVARALDRLAAGAGDPAAGPELLRGLLRLAAAHAAGCAAAPARGEATWRRVQEHIAERCHAPIDRAGAARELGLNPTYLSDLCRRHGGGGFVRLVEAVRLERARQLQRDEPEATDAAIATRVGFASAGYFVRVFRRATGTPPGRWRLTGRPPGVGT